MWTYWGFFFGQFGIWISITLFSWGIIFLQGHCLLFWFRWWNFFLLFNFFALWFFSLFAFSFTFNLFCLTLKFIFSSAPVSSSRSFLFLEWLDSRFSRMTELGYKPFGMILDHDSCDRIVFHLLRRHHGHHHVENVFVVHHQIVLVDQLHLRFDQLQQHQHHLHPNLPVMKVQYKFEIITNLTWLSWASVISTTASSSTATTTIRSSFNLFFAISSWCWGCLCWWGLLFYYLNHKMIVS